MKKVNWYEVHYVLHSHKGSKAKKKKKVDIFASKKKAKDFVYFLSDDWAFSNIYIKTGHKKAAAHKGVKMKFCNICRVRPGVVDVRGFSLCHTCLGKTAHLVGLAANHVFNPATCPPLTHCTGLDSSATPATSTANISSTARQSAITLLIGLGLLVATVGVIYAYSDSGSSKSPLKFGFGLSKSLNIN